jgi:hypothetical protein
MVQAASNHPKSSSNENDIVQLHHLSHRHSRERFANVNKFLVKNSQHQSRRKRKKRKHKDEIESKGISYHSEVHNFSHITNDNNNGNHIIKSNSKESKRRRIKSIDLADSNKHNRSSDDAGGQSWPTNLTLWIFRVNQSIDGLDTSNINDKVSVGRSSKLPTCLQLFF